MEVGIRGLYQDHGYFKVNVNVASLKTVEVNRKGIPGPFPGVGESVGKPRTSLSRLTRASSIAWAS